MLLTIIKCYFLQIWLNLTGFLYYFILWGPSSSQGYQQTYHWRKQWFLPLTAVVFSQARLVANKDRRDESNVDVLKSCKQSWWSQQHWATADGRSGMRCRVPALKYNTPPGHWTTDNRDKETKTALDKWVFLATSGSRFFQYSSKEEFRYQDTCELFWVNRPSRARFLFH